MVATAFPSGHGLPRGDAPRTHARWALCLGGSHGFTLVEIVTALAVVGVLAAIAMPGIERVSRSLRIEGSAQTLVGDLNRARSEAIKRNDVVAVTHAAGNTYRIGGVGLRRLDAEVELEGSSPDTIRFNGFGSVMQGREVYTLRLGPLERRVVLDASGQARVD